MCSIMNFKVIRMGTSSAKRIDPLLVTGIFSWISSLPFTGEITDSVPTGPPRDKTNEMSLRQAKTQISLGIRPVWSESSRCAQWVAKDQSFLHADSKDSDQIERMPRLIWVFAGRTATVGFVMRRLNWLITIGSISEIECCFLQCAHHHD